MEKQVGNPISQCLLVAVCLILVSALVIKHQIINELTLPSEELPVNSSCLPLSLDTPDSQQLVPNGTVGLEFVDSQGDFSPAIFCGHLFHFMEFVIAAFVLLEQGGVDHLKVGWVRVYYGSPPRVLGLNAWEGSNGHHNIMLVHQLWPNAVPALGRHRPPASRVIAVDRWSCDFGSEMQMLLKYTPHFNQYRWYDAVHHRAARVSHDARLRRLAKVRVTYIEASAGRRHFTNESHRALMHVLSSMAGVQLKQLQLDSLSWNAQMAAMQARLPSCPTNDGCGM